MDVYLRSEGKHATFAFEGEDRNVVLKNDCRSYPLRARATFDDGNVASRLLTVLEERCRERFGAAFQETIPGARAAHLPGVASKVALYASLDTAEVHFYKDAPRKERRRVIGWLLER